MYNEIMNRIMDYRYNFLNNYGYDPLEICDLILMHPKTYHTFLQDAIFLCNINFDPHNIKLLGMNFKPCNEVEENNFKFCLK